MDQEKATKNHILFVQPELEGVGGVQTVVPVIAKRFGELGYQVSAFTTYGDVPNDKVDWFYERSLGEELSSNIFHKIIKLIKRGRELVKSINDAKPDILIVSTTGVSVLSLFLKRLGIIKLPILVYVHESFALGSKMEQYLIKRSYPTADGVICVSFGIKNEMKESISIPEDLLVLAYNGLPQIDIYGKRTDLSGQPPLFVTASRLEKVKGADVLVDLFLRYFVSHPGHLLILGEGSLRGSLEEKVKKAGLEKSVTFAGYVPNVQEKISEASAYVSCARAESFGVSLVEALTVGVPVVVSDAPYGPREIMDQFDLKEVTYPYRTDYGYLIGSPLEYGKDELYQQLSEALQSVQNDHFDSEKLQNRAKAFNVKDQVKGIEKMVKKCLT